MGELKTKIHTDTGGYRGRNKGCFGCLKTVVGTTRSTEAVGDVETVGEVSSFY